MAYWAEIGIGPIYIWSTKLMCQASKSGKIPHSHKHVRHSARVKCLLNACQVSSHFLVKMGSKSLVMLERNTLQRRFA